MPARSPDLYASLRCFTLAAFSLLGREVERGAEVPFAFEEHDSLGRTTFYEFRPLVRAFIEEREGRLAELPDAALALAELKREPAAAIFARAHNADRRVDEEQALVRTVLLPLVTRTADACGGFDWDDESFDRHYGELEHALYSSERTFAAIAPVIGLEAGGAVDLGGNVRLRHAATGEFSTLWPESKGLQPTGFGEEPDRLLVLHFEQTLPAEQPLPPDSVAEIGDAVTALRLTLGGPIAAGPVLFERLDWQPFGIRPVLPIAATQPPGEPTRLDSIRAPLVARLRQRLSAADDDRPLGEALDRWELACFQDEPFRSEQLRSALDSLFGGADGPWAAAVRGAMLVGETARERAEILRRLQRLQGGKPGSRKAEAAIRQALIETLLAGDRAALLASLDEALLGLRPRPSAQLAAVG